MSRKGEKTDNIKAKRKRTKIWSTKCYTGNKRL